jgi:hypothetical protein
MATIVFASLPATRFALSHTLDALPGVAFECERIIESDNGALMPLVWVRGVSEAALAAALAQDETVEDATLVASFDDELLYRIAWVDELGVILRMLTNAEATILSAVGRGDEWRLRLMFPDRDSLTTTHEFCRAHGLDFHIESIRDMDGHPAGRHGLTDEQYDALVHAVRHGYYDVPKRVSLCDLADGLGISHQALSERLRRGVATLVSDALLVGEASTAAAADLPQEG